MKIPELLSELKKYESFKYYSLNENYPGTHTIKLNKGRWEYFYLDDRGGVHNMKTFSSEDEACEYVYHDALRIMGIFETAYAQAENESE